MGTLGIVILSSFPFKLFSKTRTKNSKKIYVKIHPDSVKRNKKGF